MLKKLFDIATSSKERSMLTKQASLWMTSSLRDIDSVALMHDIDKFSVALAYFHGGALTLGRQLMLDTDMIFPAYMGAVSKAFNIEDFTIYKSLHPLVRSLAKSPNHLKYYHLGSSNVTAWVRVMATIPIDTQLPCTHPDYNTSLARVLDDL